MLDLICQMKMDAHSNRVQSGHRTNIYPSVRPMSPIYINIYRDTIHRTDGRKYNISIGQVESIERLGIKSLNISIYGFDYACKYADDS